MSGHSHWAGIKHKKGIADKKRGQIFSKMAKIITIAAKKGGDPNMNPGLRLAIEQAKSVNMPNDNIERAIKKGTREDRGTQLEEIVYEAYGPEGIQLIIEAITDNKNRTLSEVRQILNQYNGRLAEGGSVKWNFNKMGIITIDKNQTSKNNEELELIAIDCGADDIKWRDDILEIYIKPENLEKIKQNLEQIGLKIENSGLEWTPKNEIKIEDQAKKEQIEKLFEALDDNEDVNEIYSNVIL